LHHKTDPYILVASAHKRRKFMWYSILALALLLPSTAQAVIQQENLVIPGVCGPHGELVGELKEKFGEVPVLVAVVEDVAIAEMYVNPASSTWSFVMTMASTGKSCILASGKPIEFIKPPKAKSKGIAL
jgi:hypothetical protein